MQVYVETMPELFGPVVVGQDVSPPVPDTDQLTAPYGATAPREPVTVAVYVIVPPKVGAFEAPITTVGVAIATVVEVVEATGDTSLYALSPG